MLEPQKRKKEKENSDYTIDMIYNAISTTKTLLLHISIHLSSPWAGTQQRLNSEVVNSTSLTSLECQGAILDVVIC